MEDSLYDYCMENGMEHLLEQWDQEKNQGCTPLTISRGSKIKAWWQCPVGHVWKAAVYSRTGARSGCPYCSHTLVWPGTDLASVNQGLAAQWHPTKNGTLTPEQVLPSTHRIVWWKCDKGHEWRAQIKSRTKGAGCPVCANRSIRQGVNDLATTHPELAAQWHPTKNGDAKPEHFVLGSEKKVWWQCDKGHEWQAVINSRVGGSGCPVCAGKVIVPGFNDLASMFPSVAQQWHPAKNGTLKPDGVSAFSNRNVWWQCELGHEWRTTVASRTHSGGGCPICSGKKVLAGFNDLATTHPELAAQWHPSLNESLTPQMVTRGSSKKVWWQCPVGHVWKTVVYSRAGGAKRSQCGCPVCAGKVKESRQNRYAEILAGEKKLPTGAAGDGT